MLLAVAIHSFGSLPIDKLVLRKSRKTGESYLLDFCSFTKNCLPYVTSCQHLYIAMARWEALARTPVSLGSPWRLPQWTSPVNVFAAPTTHAARWGCPAQRANHCAANTVGPVGAGNATKKHIYRLDVCPAWAFPILTWWVIMLGVCMVQGYKHKPSMFVRAS